MLRTIHAKVSLLIVLTAVECSKIWDTVVTDGDTDLMVFLFYHCSSDNH